MNTPSLTDSARGLDGLDEVEIRLVTEAVGGVQRARRLHHKRADECRKLRAALKQAQQQQRRQKRATIVTGGDFNFGDRVIFIRRPAVSPTAVQRYIALREGGSEGGQPYYLATASENSLLGRRLQSSTSNAMGSTTSGAASGAASLAASALAALPPVALGTVVHVEQQQAPSDAAAAARLGVRAGTSYGVITAEMSELNIDGC